jgi:tetratricopeptide (TPR) repeat protein
MTSVHHKLFRSAVASALALFIATSTLPAAATQLGLGLPSSAASPVPPTPSAEDEAAGKRHFKRGDELFKQGRFLEAAHEFEAGFAVAPRPLFLLNIGHSYRKAQDLRRARQAYEDFLKADPTTSFRADVEDLIKTIDDAIGASSMPSPAAPTPAPTPGNSLNPPPAPITSSPPAGPITGLPPAAPVPMTGPRTGTIDLAPPVILEAEKAAPASSSDSIFKSPWFWGAVGVVVAAGIAGTVYGVSRPPACNATRCLRETD